MLHRIPRDRSRFLRDVVDDAIHICNLILSLVGREYPELNASLLKEEHKDSNKAMGGDEE
jgi:hypothetical protein